MILIATDLDGTLFPNTNYSYNSDYYDIFRNWIHKHRSDVYLIYITGRHLELALEGITEYNVPIPDSITCDVGSSIYFLKEKQWVLSQKWQNIIKIDFDNRSNEDIISWFHDLEIINPQEKIKQTPLKVSFYAQPDLDSSILLRQIDKIIQLHTINATVIISKDPISNRGLVDIVPKSATKENALKFLIRRTGLSRTEALYCGDTGNDILPITSGIQSVLVANASEAVRNEIKKTAKKRNTEDTVFYAKKNYLEGIIEGLEHFNLAKIKE